MNSSSGDCSVFGRNILEPENASLTLDRLDESFKQTITTIQLIISVFGIVGHILSLVVLITTKSLHTTPNFFIGVLSAVDLLLCLTIPVSSVQIVIDNNNNAIQPELCKAIGNDFGHFGYNAKFGTCVITSYCMRNYFYMTTLLLLTIFLPASVLTGYAYACIIRKLLIMRRKIELNEKINLVKPGIALKDFKVDDSRMETSQATEHIAVGNDSAYDLLDEESEYRKEMADYRSRVEKAFMVQQSQPGIPNY
ncbi:uncharacterized protein [Watersipora subatra]|uniref:uncharacterized protein n=1 Tax=Watersipora subatra TaxID=2589382 RepID=UPI00355BD9AB